MLEQISIRFRIRDHILSISHQSSEIEDILVDRERERDSGSLVKTRDLRHSSFQLELTKTSH